MKKLIKKLKSRRGESLVEVLCAILIFTLSSVGMYSMVMAANSINATAKEADRAYQQQMEIVEKADTAGTDGEVVMTITKSGTNTVVAQMHVDVKLYQTEDLYSYYRAP